MLKYRTKNTHSFGVDNAEVFGGKVWPFYLLECYTVVELFRLIAIPTLISTLLNHLPIARSSGSDGFKMQVCIKDIKFKLLLSLSFIF